MTDQTKMTKIYCLVRGYPHVGYDAPEIAFNSKHNAVQYKKDADINGVNYDIIEINLYLSEDNDDR